MKRFDYFAPASLDECLALLRDRPEAAPLAGGTDLVVRLKKGDRSMGTLVSLQRIPELQRRTHDGAVRLGSMTRLAHVAEDPLLRDRCAALAAAAGWVGSTQIRNVATIGGNVCNAAPSAELGPPLLCLEARATLVGADGERALPLEQFFLGPGKTSLRPGELLREIVIPAREGRNACAYLRHTPRSAMDLAVASAAVGLTVDEDGVVVDARIALGAVAPVPMRARRAESLIVGHRVSPALQREAGATASGEAAPISDLRASAGFRTHLVGVLVSRAIGAAYARATAPMGGA